MGFDRTRFTRPARSRPAPRVIDVIDVDVRPKHETLYDVIVVSPDASSREIRRVARALRRNLPDTSALHDVCLAEEVLGRAELRREYDALLARLHAASQPIPRIGPAIEGTRLGPEVAPRSGNAGGQAGGQALKGVFQVGFAILMLIALFVLVGSRGSKYSADTYKIPEFKPIQFPKLDPSLYEYKYRPIELPKFELPKYEPPKYEPPKIEIPKIKIPDYQPPKLELPKYDLRKIELPKYEVPEIPPKTASPETAPPETAPPETAPPETAPPEIDPPAHVVPSP